MKVQKQNILFMSLTVHLIPLFICLICNYFINRLLTWSLIVALSLVESFLVTWAVLSATKKVVKKVLLVISVSIIPYLAFLSMILRLPIVFSLGSCIATLSMTAVWSIYGLFAKCHKRIFVVIGCSFLISIPLSLGITYLSTYFANTAYIDFSSDIFHVIISLILAGISILIDKWSNRE